MKLWLSCLVVSLVLFNCALFPAPIKPDVGADPNIPAVSIKTQIAEISPKEDAVDVATISQVKVVFKVDSLNLATTPRSLCVLLDQKGRKIDCQIKCCPGRICLIPDKRLDPATKYFVTITNLAYVKESQILKELRGALVWSFVTGA